MKTITLKNRKNNLKRGILLSILFFQFSATLFAQGTVGCWREFSAGNNFCLAIKTDGTLWGWGQNGNLLGLNGNMADQNLPVQIGTANDWQSVSAGTVHSLAVKTNGTLWAWGNGQFGQLGNGAFNNATWTVTQMGTATDWQSVSAGNRFSLAIKNTGTLWAWGLNNTGQLGINNLIDQNLPVQVGFASNWLRIEAGDQHALATDFLGNLFAWGNNTFGQLGDGTNTTSLFPIPIAISNPINVISAGFDHSMVLDSSGFIRTFGNNTTGQLADGTNTASNIPILISINSDGTINQYVNISAGSGHSLAIKNDTTLWSSGLGNFGQLGLGNNGNTNVLNQVGTGTNWLDISAGNTHSLALDTSLTLSSTGRNIEGQLGIGTFVSSNTLQLINCPGSLGNEEITLNSTNISVYPNPTNDIINVDYTLENSTKITIQITNIQGQIINEIKIDRNSGTQTETIDLSNQSSGMYFITLTTENNSFTSKVVKR
jgi:alpha-tubulin suppressor-like RCC1 family protein